MREKVIHAVLKKEDNDISSPAAARLSFSFSGLQFDFLESLGVQENSGQQQESGDAAAPIAAQEIGTKRETWETSFSISHFRLRGLEPLPRMNSKQTRERYTGEGAVIEERQPRCEAFPSPSQFGSRSLGSFFIKLVLLTFFSFSFSFFSSRVLTKKGSLRVVSHTLKCTARWPWVGEWLQFQDRLQYLYNTTTGCTLEHLCAETPVHNVAKEFEREAQTWAQVIVAEMHLCAHAKVLTPTLSGSEFGGADTYVVHNIIFKVVKVRRSAGSKF